MEYHTVAVRLDNGVIRSIDGSPLPEQANALLVILPERVGDLLASSQPMPSTANTLRPATNQASRIFGRVEWNTLPVSGARVILKAPGDYYQLPALAETTSDANGQFALENTAEGELWIYAISPGPEYSEWIGRSLAISSGQSVDVGVLELSKIMRLLEPANGAQITTPTPVLRWAAFPGAARYHVDVFIDETGVAVMRQDTTNTSIVVAPLLAPGVRYQWSVHANSAAGHQIAYFSCWTFTVQP